MIRRKHTSLTLAAVTAAGISLFSPNADAQGWRNVLGWGQQTSNTSCSANTLRSDVYAVDRLANQTAYQFSREIRNRCSCSVKLQNLLKKNAILSRNLVTAFNGNCKCAFKKAACALNTNTAAVAKQSRKISYLSCMIKSNISETVTTAKRIHKNAEKFVPRSSSYTNHRAPAPSYNGNNRYTNNNRNRNSNNNRYANNNRNRNGNNTPTIDTNDREGMMALLRSLLGGRTVPTSQTVHNDHDNHTNSNNSSGGGYDNNNDHGGHDHHGHNH